MTRRRDRDPSGMVAYLRHMAQQQRDLAVEFDQQADRIAERHDGQEVEADLGHTWRLTVESRASSAVVGDQHHHDAPEFTPLGRAVEVRAWNLRQALTAAAALPLQVWFDLDEQQ